MLSAPLSRRAFLLAASATLVAQAPAVQVPADTLVYRGFTVDMALAAQMPNRAAIEASMKRQIDITADCGVSADIMAFFRAQSIKLKTDRRGGPGRYTGAGGVEIQAAALPPENPILLHELLHAFHYRRLPDGARNADVLRFYGNAQRGQLYPPDEYVMSSAGEFFAVTASLYLWGKVARPPYDRATLCVRQPYYCAWLGEVFGVRK